MSGCSGSSSSTQSPATSTGSDSSGTASIAAGSGDKITVSQDGNTITITGGKASKLASDPFPMDAGAWYIITSTYKGKDMSDFIAEIATPDDIAADEAIGGLLPMELNPATDTIIQPKGTYKTTNYKLLADTTDGPWTVVIQKSPTPVASGQASFSHKVADSYNSITPYFHLSKGSATFTVNQGTENKFAAAASVDLYDADTGEYVASITHNDDEATITETEDIPADGNYIIHVACGNDWSLSFTQ